ncbi:Uncharacterised protein [Acinetobacter baumannii]|nr:Uncharacterised protein [Acinetobacter baumannii]
MAKPYSKFSISTMNITSSSRQMMPMFSSPQEAKKKRVKVLMTGVRCVALAATIAAMLILSSRKKSKLWVCGVIK